MNSKFLALLIVMAVELACGETRAQPLSASDINGIDYSKPGQLIPISGGRRLNLRCTGSAAPTVILDAGGGQFSIAWRKVQSQVAHFTRVCSYDRAGYGFSDPNTRPSTAANIVDDLHDALDHAGIRPPFILAGHSAGGLYATLYTDLHPSDVIGLVLVDPGFASQNHDNALDAWSSFPAILADQQAQQAAHRKLMADCAASARAGKLKNSLGQCSCADTPKDQPQLAGYIAEYCSGPKPYDSMLAEEAALIGTIGDVSSISNDQEAAAARLFGSMPLTILTNGKGWSYTDNADLNNRLTMVWRAGHVALAGRSLNGKVVFVQGSGHSIEEERPDVVVKAISDIVKLAREATPSLDRTPKAP